MKTKVRKITVAGVAYAWRVTCRTHRDPALGLLATTTFSAHEVEHRRSPLRVTFTTWDDPVSGNPLYQGWDLAHSGGERVVVNLNRPRISRALIELAREQGWDPRRMVRPYVIEDGLCLLRLMGYDIEPLRPRLLKAPSPQRD